VDNADLKLETHFTSDQTLSGEQQARKIALFDMLVTVFESAYISLYSKPVTKRKQEMWQPWSRLIGQ
jgi:hypothetical protein